MKFSNRENFLAQIDYEQGVDVKISFYPFFTHLIFILCFSSCAGYKFKRKSNPLEQFNIETLSIPMFFNRSSIPNLSGALTKEFTLIFTSFPNLRVYSGQNAQTDAILLGVIESAPSHLSALSGSSNLKIDSAGSPAFANIGNRKKFYVRNKANVNLSLNLILIKNPTHKEVELFLSPQGKFLYKHPKVIFAETLGFGTQVGWDYTSDLSLDSSRVVTFTKNRGNMEKAINDMAQNVARDFKDMILYAF